MSIKDMTRVWETSERKGSDLLLLLAVADFADENGYCWPGHSKLATRARITERAVMMAVADMEKSGELYVEHRRGKGNRYVLLAGLNHHERLERMFKVAPKLSEKFSLLKYARFSLICERSSLNNFTDTHKRADDPSRTKSKNHQDSKESAGSGKNGNGKHPVLEDSEWTRMVVKGSFDMPFDDAAGSPSIAGQVHNILKALGKEKATLDELRKAYIAHRQDMDKSSGSLGRMKKPETIAGKVVAMRNAKAPEPERQSAYLNARPA